MFVVVAAAMGCSAPVPKKPAPRYTPAKTLYLLKLAYNTPDPSLFDGLFDDGFSYEAARPPAGMPAGWGKKEEVSAHRAIVGGAFHSLLEMDASERAVGRPDASALRYRTPPLEVKLRVWREPNYCFCSYGTVVFEFRRRDLGSEWRIIRIEDATGVDPKSFRTNAETEVTSWAEIKWYYLSRRDVAGEP